VLVSIGLLGSLLSVAVSNFFNMHLDQTFHVPTESIGVALAAVKAAPLAGYILAPVLVKRFGAYATALFSMISACLSAASIGLASGWVAAASGYALMSLLGAFGGPASSLLYQNAVPAEARPVVAGAQNAAGGLASAATLFSGGFIIAALGYGRFFLLGLALNAASVALFAVWFAAPARRKGAAAA
jgi:predicted MFS family arabinose efflux permease